MKELSNRKSNKIYPSIEFLGNLVRNRMLLFELAKQDFVQRFAGNFLGVTWAFLNPIIQVFILWFVFNIGFRVQPVNDVPFIFWLLAGFFPWLHLSESIVAGTNCILEKSYLVKKVVFRVSTLPIIKLASVAVIHFFFIFALVIFFLLNGVGEWIYKLQIIYYVICLLALSLTVTWITSAFVVFVRDVSQIVSIFVQFGFWLTPIFWNDSIIPEKYKLIININPATYIVNGYRDSLLGGRWFYEKPIEGIYFWSLILILLVFGVFVFKRLRIHFADVL